MESVEQSPPIRAKAIATTLKTATARGKCQRSRRETTGASKKLIKIARMRGSKNSFAQAKAASMRTRYATSTSLRTSIGFSDMRLFMSYPKSANFSAALSLMGDDALLSFSDLALCARIGLRSSSQTRHIRHSAGGVTSSLHQNEPQC